MNLGALVLPNSAFLRIAADESLAYARVSQLNARTLGGPMNSHGLEQQAKLLAAAPYEIRVLLAGYLGSQSDSEISIRQAAHLAYSLHNEALAIIEGRSFEPADAVRRLAAVDLMLGSAFSDRFSQILESLPGAPRD